MQEGNVPQVELEQYRGTIVPIYLDCEFCGPVDIPPVLGIVNVDTYAIKEKHVKDTLRENARKHKVAMRHPYADITSVVIIGNRDNPKLVAVLVDRFRF